MMKPRAILWVAGAVVACGSLLTAQTKPNFSGEWTLNESKSDFGPLPMPAKFVRKIEHNEPNLKSVTTQSGRQGEITTELSYTTDGKECTNTIRGAEVKGTAKWDGAVLVIESKREAGGQSLTMTERWTLLEDGKTITVALHMLSSQGEADIKMVLEKQ